MTAATPTLSEAERFARVRLARTPRIGPVRFLELLEQFGCALDAVNGLNALTKARGLKPFNVPSERDIRAQAQRLEAFGGRWLILGDSDYPAALAAIADPPIVLEVMGNTQHLARPAVGIVGARSASAAGLKLASQFASELGRAGLVTVSGLARGIDTAVHTASLSTGTIACLAGGLDTFYPPENKALQRAIADTGLLVSEMPLGSTPTAQHFPRRNRLISGLSAGTLVVEATERSGSLITARYAGEQGRDVFAVPGSPLDGRSKGTNRLIKDGAYLAETAQDILDQLTLFTDTLLSGTPIAGPHTSTAPLSRTAPAHSAETHLGAGTQANLPLASGTAHKAPNAAASSATHTAHAPTTENGHEKAVVMQALSTTPLPIDDIIRATKLAPAKVLLEIQLLELEGILARYPGARVALTHAK